MRLDLTRLRVQALFSLLSLFSLLAACGRTPLQHQEAYVFGTRVEVLVVSPDAEQGRTAIAAVLREFDRLHRSYHAWQASDLTRLNEAIAAGKPATVSPELADLLKESQALSLQSNGLFDPGIGQLIALWGFQNDEFKAQLPDPAHIRQWLASHPGLRHLTIDGQTVRSQNRQTALDFGGYLKGVALDRAAAILRAQGIEHALINIGGNILAMGNKQGSAWRVGIQHPRQAGPLATLELADGEAIGTSGDYQRYFELDGQRYAHLLDPRSGYPVTHTQAITIVTQGPNAGMRSDASSKPLFIAGADHWPAQAKQMQIDHVLRVDASGRLQVSAALAKRLQFVGQKPDLEVIQ